MLNSISYPVFYTFLLLLIRIGVMNTIIKINEYAILLNIGVKKAIIIAINDAMGIAKFL
jgi:hypothetical protein